MKFKTFTAVTVLAAAGLATSVANAQFGMATSPAYIFDSSPVSTDTQLSLGFTFTVTRGISITAVGYWDQNGDGFLTDHQIGIYAGDGADGPGPLLFWTDLPAGKSGFLVNSSYVGRQYAMYPSGFRYQYTDLYLSPGEYTIAGLSPDTDPAANDPWVYGGPSETTGFGPPCCGYGKFISIGPDAARYSYGTPFLADPSSHYADYQFYAVNLVAGPEPATWTMMLLGFAGLGYASIRKARQARLAPAIK